MSKTYFALKKAELESRQAAGQPSRAVDPHPAVASPQPPRTAGPPPAAERMQPRRAADRPPVVAQHDPARLEYERIGVWLKNPASGARRQAVMVVACSSGTGATTTTALLATTLAETRRSRVLVIDSNFRTPGLNLIFKMQPEADDGNGDSFADPLPFGSRINKTDRQNLYVLTNDRLSSATPEALEGDEIDELLAELRRRFDFILFDAAPALDFPDAYALAPKVDGIILVTDSDRTLIADAQRAQLDLERAGGKVLGVVLNRHRDYVPRFVRRFIGASH